MEPFILSIETDAGTYIHGYHLGTIEKTARDVAVDAFHHWKPRQGTRIITTALKRDGRLFDTYDGNKWSSDY